MGPLTHLAGIPDGQGTAIDRALTAVRTHLGMEVAYLSKFDGDSSLFRNVDAPGLEGMIKAGDRMPRDQMYCRHILDGRLPNLIPDTSEEPFTQAFAITSEVPVRAHASVPIMLPNGETYGMFCCLSAQPNTSLNDRDLDVMRAIAEIATHQVIEELMAEQAKAEASKEIERAVSGNILKMHYQPIWKLDAPEPVGFEALSRFQSEPRRSPDKWFADAALVGRGPELERMAIESALAVICSFPKACYLSVNTSPELILTGQLIDVFASLPLHRIKLEITEHAAVSDYVALEKNLRSLRASGMQLAVDDAGAGYASFSHILQLQPDVIKLDLSLVRDIHKHPARRALAAAMLRFGEEIGAKIIAEGLEKKQEMDTLSEIGITFAQGYLLGRPMPLDGALTLFRSRITDKTQSENVQPKITPRKQA